MIIVFFSTVLIKLLGTKFIQEDRTCSQETTNPGKSNNYRKRSLLPSKPVLNPFHLSFTTHFDFSDYFHCATAAKHMLKQQTKLKIWDLHTQQLFKEQMTQRTTDLQQRQYSPWRSEGSRHTLPRPRRSTSWHWPPPLFCPEIPREPGTEVHPELEN